MSVPGLVRFCGVAAGLLLLAGCALRPAGEDQERRNAEEAGRAWEKQPLEAPPALPETPTLQDYLQHAFYANADLQRAYWQWRAALEQIPQDSSWPNIAVPFSVMFTKESMNLWDRTTLGLTNDPMSNIPYPGKLSTAGRRALEDARAAGARFEEAKFLLQGKVLSTYYDLALLAESIRIQEQNVDLLRAVARQSSGRLQTGGEGQQDLLRIQTELDLAQNDLENLRSQTPPLIARFNALLGRAATEPVPLPSALPAPRALPVPDDRLFQVAADRSPEMAALAREVAGRKEALDLARKAYIPDFGLSAAITGNVSQTLGGMIVLPTRLEAIKAGVEQARANLRAAEAARVQYGRDLTASFVLNLYVLRNDERQVALFEDVIVPRAQQAIKIAQSSYAAGRLSYQELLDAQRALLSAQLATAQLRTEREKALAAIETWSAVDVETFKPGRSAVRGARASGSGGM